MTTIFFSYSHKDEVLRNELEAHLALLKHEGLVESWHDRRIVAGDELDEVIFSQLEAANIILLLVSSDFMSSDYCYSREMTRAMERHHAQEAKVIPIILRHCEWTSAPFGKLMAVPRDAKPVTSWPDRDEAFADVAKRVRQVVEGFRTSNVPTKSSSPRSIASSNVSALPRSSNLRLKQEFSELNVDQFLRSSFDFICRFFEGSVSAINTRNPDVTGTFELIDSRRMAAILYRSGKKITECSIRLDVRGRSNGIAYSYDVSASSNSHNEMIMPEAGNQSLHFKSMGMAWGSGKDKQMSQEGAAEFLWELFLKQAQS